MSLVMERVEDGEAKSEAIDERSPTPVRPPHRRSRPLRRLRRPSVGRGKSNLRARELRIDASMYPGQHVSPNVKLIAQSLGIDEEEVRAMNMKKRLAMSALIGIDKSELIGESATRMRVLSAAIEKGDDDAAKDILNAADDAVRAAEMDAYLPKLEFLQDVDFMDSDVEDEEVTAEDLELRLIFMGAPHAPSTPLPTFNLREEAKKDNVADSTVETLEKRLALLREIGDGLTTWCGTGKDAEKLRMVEKDKEILEEGIKQRKLRAELLQLQTTKLAPNLERQREIEQSLASGKNRAALEEQERNFTYIKNKMETMTEVMNNVYSDGKANLSLNRQMNENMKDLTKKQQKYFVKTMKSLMNIELKVSDSRLTRQIGWSNAMGLSWLVKDNWDIIMHLLFNEDGEFSPSAVRALKQAMNMAITAVEVVLKNMQGLAWHIASGLECLKKTTVGCLVMWGMKTLLFVLVALGIFLIAKTTFPSLVNYISWMLQSALSLLKVCGEKLSEWCRNSIFSDESIKEFSKMLADCQEWFLKMCTDYTPQIFQDFFSMVGTVVNGVWNAISGFYDWLAWMGFVGKAKGLEVPTPLPPAGGAATSSWWPFTQHLDAGALTIPGAAFGGLHMIEEEDEEEEECGVVTYQSAALRYRRARAYKNLRF